MAKGQREIGGYAIKPHQEARYFESDFLERFSKCPGWLPLVVWVPIFFVLMWLSATRTELAGGSIALFAVLGLFFWTFAEYWLHRKLFHFRRFPRLHYILHGAHHEYPDDRGRVVFPPTASLALGALIFGLMVLVFGLHRAMPFFAGFVVGYLWYDMTHFWTHVAKPKTRYGKFLRRHHMLHHYSEPDKKFGVSNPMWDFVFGTYGKPASKGPRTN
ncbi:MAG: sterol desaturase family protein [Myxococcales bacterium]|nr:sterol desaturase family protein [Myxococcales bacterium]MCB9732493.1 sterol desaturase family protein [Deltaproteobacteria bacterium]